MMDNQLIIGKDAKGSGPGPIFRYYSGICAGTDENPENSLDSRFFSRDTNLCYKFLI
jgi:hypothetical protein